CLSAERRPVLSTHRPLWRQRPVNEVGAHVTISTGARDRGVRMPVALDLEQERVGQLLGHRDRLPIRGGRVISVVDEQNCVGGWFVPRTFVLIGCGSGPGGALRITPDPVWADSAGTPCGQVGKREISGGITRVWGFGAKYGKELHCPLSPRIRQRRGVGRGGAPLPKSPEQVPQRFPVDPQEARRTSLQRNKRHSEHRSTN